MDVTGLNDGFAARAQRRIAAQRNVPFEKAPIEYDWNERGNFTRRYAHSVNTFALRAFFNATNVDAANDELRALFEHYLAHPTDLYEAHSFHWSGALYTRLWSFFGPEGTVGAGRLADETASRFLEVMFAWSKKASGDLNPDASEPAIWRFPNSENHHAMGIVTTWFFCGVLANHEDYRDRAFESGGTAADHREAWTDYLKTYFRARAGRGQSIEIASKNYNAHTIQNWYTVYDFADDAALKRMAGQYLDLYWATWAEEQIDGVRGGGMTRIYQGPRSRTAAGGEVSEMAGLHLDTRDDDRMSTTDWVVSTSDYRMPEAVMALALDVDGRGCYEVSQRCLGLAEPGWERVPNPPVVPFGVSGLRPDFGGFLRYSWCTPDFVIGTLMCEARPIDDWTGTAAQNRWQGVMFRGHPDAAIVPECQAVDTHLNLNNHANTMNQQWSLQKLGTLITQKLRQGMSRQTGPSRVWISAQGLSDPVEEGDWVFVESDGAYAGVCVADSGGEWDGEEEGGRWLRCREDLSPIVIEVARKADWENFAAFRQAVVGSPMETTGGRLTYTSPSGHAFAFHTDYSALPEVDGETVDLAPGMVYDSPQVRSEWDSGVVTVRYGEGREVLDFRV